MLPKMWHGGESRWHNSQVLWRFVRGHDKPSRYMRVGAICFPGGVTVAPFCLIFFAWKKWWNLRPWGIFWSNKRFPKQSQDILELVSYDRIHSGFFLKNQLLSLKPTDITPENGGLEYHSFGIAYFHGRTVSFRECRILWEEWDDFFLSFKDLPPEIPSEKNGSHTPYHRRYFFCRFVFSSQRKLAA